MERCSFVGIGKLNHPCVVIRSSEKSNPGRQIVAREAGGHHDRRHEHQERVDVRRPLLVDERWIDAVLDQGGLMFDSLVHDCIEPMIGHDLQHVEHQCLARDHIGVMLRRRIRIRPAAVRAFRGLRKQRRGHCSLARSERSISAREIHLEHGVVRFNVARSPSQQGLQVRDDHRIDNLRPRLA
jgi:hypothetical protein